MFDCHGISATKKSMVSNVNILYDKDGLDIVGSSHLGFIDCYVNTRDDAIFIGTGYAFNTPVLKDTFDISFERITFESDWVDIGNAWQIWSASWDNWLNGRTYIWNEFCINAGRIYGNTSQDDTVGTVAPTHTSGTVTGADGIAWKFMQDGTLNYTSVYDISIKDINFNCSRKLLKLRNIVTEGTEGICIIDNLTVDDLRIKASGYKGSGTPIDHYAQIGNLTIKNTDIIADVSLTNSEFILSLLTHAIKKPVSLDHLVLDNCIIDVEFFFKIQNPEVKITKFTTIDCEIITPNIIIKPKTNQFDNANACNFTRTIFTFDTVWVEAFGYGSLIKSEENNISTTVRLVDCEFKTAVRYVVYIKHTGCKFTLISDGTIFITPFVSLFRSLSEDLADNGSIIVDIINSNGIVTDAKLRPLELQYEDNVLLTNVDVLAEATFVFADSGGNALNKVVVDFSETLDSRYKPEVSAFSISGKTILSYVISGKQLIFTTVENFLSTDINVFGYVEPTINQLRGINTHYISDFSLQPIFNVLNNLLSNGNFLDGTTDWVAELGTGFAVTDGIATVDENGGSYSMLTNNTFNPIAESYDLWVKVAENNDNRSLRTVFANDGLNVSGADITTSAIPVGVTKITLSALETATMILIAPSLNALPMNMKFAYVVMRKAV